LQQGAEGPHRLPGVRLCDHRSSAIPSAAASPRSRQLRATAGHPGTVAAGVDRGLVMVRQKLV
jgi:hypothetical protein